MERLMSAGEVAAVLNVSRSAAYSLLASGGLTTIRIGKAVRVSRLSLEEWIRDRTLSSTAEGVPTVTPETDSREG